MPIGDLPPRIRTPWTDLRTIVLVERVRAARSLSVETIYYVTSHDPQPKLLAKRIRDHWKIESQLHHCLDVSFDEDKRRIHHEDGAQNFALIARHALSMIKREPSSMSVARKRRRAAWSRTYVFHVLATGLPYAWMRSPCGEARPNESAATSGRPWLATHERAGLLQPRPVQRHSAHLGPRCGP